MRGFEKEATQGFRELARLTVPTVLSLRHEKEQRRVFTDVPPAVFHKTYKMPALNEEARRIAKVLEIAALLGGELRTPSRGEGQIRSQPGGECACFSREIL